MKFSMTCNVLNDIMICIVEGRRILISNRFQHQKALSSKTAIFATANEGEIIVTVSKAIIFE